MPDRTENANKANFARNKAQRPAKLDLAAGCSDHGWHENSIWGCRRLVQACPYMSHYLSKPKQITLQYPFRQWSKRRQAQLHLFLWGKQKPWSGYDMYGNSSPTWVQSIFGYPAMVPVCLYSPWNLLPPVFYIRIDSHGVIALYGLTFNIWMLDPHVHAPSETFSCSS